VVNYYNSSNRHIRTHTAQHNTTQHSATQHNTIHTRTQHTHHNPAHTHKPNTHVHTHTRNIYTHIHTHTNTCGLARHGNEHTHTHTHTHTTYIKRTRPTKKVRCLKFLLFVYFFLMWQPDSARERCRTCPARLHIDSKQGNNTGGNTSNNNNSKGKHGIVITTQKDVGFFIFFKSQRVCGKSLFPHVPPHSRARACWHRTDDLCDVCGCMYVCVCVRLCVRLCVCESACEGACMCACVYCVVL